ncbi:endolytic transglycosylase MltG [Amycolatopsis methanolica]|uniref:endolytic transglycosylase MltG n=1 Tax=Amycolatopsis methanolica TaxID=1814 RepID=UPI0009D99D0E|nr:endolytic transglycosylase MltG [Amycolatopsis methanolica]
MTSEQPPRPGPPPPGSPRRRPPVPPPPQVPPRGADRPMPARGPGVPRHARPEPQAPATPPTPAAPPTQPPVPPRRPPARRPAPPDHGLDLFDERPPPPRPRRPRQPPPDESPTEIIHLEDDYEYDDYDDYPENADEERAEPEYIEPPDDGEPVETRRKRKPLRWLVALVVLALIGGGAWYGIDAVFGYDDFEGSGESDVLIEISAGDSTGAIGQELAGAGVVASAKAFVKASEDNSKVLSLQPGYYVVKTKMSGAAAVAKLTQDGSRVGVLQVRAGTQLDDITQPDGTVTPGVFTLLSKASCAQLNGQSTCIPVEQLRDTAAKADLAALGAPDWAVPVVSGSTDARRIEGLVAPGVYDVKPGWSAEELLGYVLKTSATRIQAAGLTASSKFQGRSPYETLIVASLIEREGVKQDFENIGQVIYNRLAQNMRLQLDSTVNYLLDKPVVTTTDDDRNRPGPYNTYKIPGLPPTPISSPSPEAIQAAEEPTQGTYVYFVKCEKNGLSCFASDLPEHEQNKTLARQRGAY